MTAPVRIAVVDDDPGQRRLLADALARSGYAAVPCEDGEAALAAVSGVSLMLLDVRMPGMSGLEVLDRLRHEHPSLPVILLTAFIDVRDAVSAIKAGALDYLEKPVDLDELIAAVDDALGHGNRRVTDESEKLDLPEGIVAESAAMRDVFRQASRVAPSDATVLIQGESGTGKDVLATYIHAHSQRKDRPLARVDCGALPASLIGAELFGHEKGAFTGADARRRGRFEEAHQSTLFLDEIGELPLEVQPAFLGALENGSFRRVGGEQDLHVDVRVLAATNRRLEDAVKQGEFREDLYYRVNVVALIVPPLRERPEDILAMTAKYLKPHKKRLSPAAERAVMAYDWPGNMRELRNALERAVLMASGATILPGDLPMAVQRAEARTPAAQGGPTGVLVGDMAEIQRQAILEALAKTQGNKTRAADLLGISRRNLVYKLREYGL